MKPADELRAATGFDPIGIKQSAQKAADLLDECEQLVADLIRWDNREGRDPWVPLIENALATLAKLRGKS